MKKFFRKIVPDFLISWYHFFLTFLGALIYGFPSRKLKVIGITGTSGKSTVVDFITRILSEAGFKIASISSIRLQVREKEWQNDLKMTMPGRFKIQNFLRQAVKAGCQYAVLEVTSEGIKQHRHRFIDFDTAVFTNLTPEHIERHGGFEKYRQAKGKLFQTVKNIHIINIDDKNADYFLKFPTYQKFCYSLNENLDIEKLKIDWKLEIENCKFIKAASIKKSSDGINFIIENTSFNLNLLGGFNVYNALAAICAGLSQGVSLETCKKALEKIEGIPGRMEVVIRGQTGVRPGSDPEAPTVVVDYAHTPDSLRKVYETLLSSKSKISPRTKAKLAAGQENQKSKMICVLGAAGGGRDKWKRPEMGKIAVQYCDQIILTNEDPYSENPSQILSEIKSGIFNFQFSILNLYEILDRREAIKKALELAKAGDTVIITGKGCEPWMCVEKGKKIPWDDRKIVREEFDKL